MEELEIQYSQAFAKPKRETISHNSLLEALAFKATRIYRYNPLDRNINSTTNLVATEQGYTCKGDSTVAIIVYVCCGRVAVATSHKKPYPNFSVNPQPFVLQYKQNHSTE